MAPTPKKDANGKMRATSTPTVSERQLELKSAQPLPQHTAGVIWEISCCKFQCKGFPLAHCGTGSGRGRESMGGSQIAGDDDSGCGNKLTTGWTSWMTDWLWFRNMNPSSFLRPAPSSSLFSPLWSAKKTRWYDGQVKQHAMAAGHVFTKSTWTTNLRTETNPVVCLWCTYGWLRDTNQTKHAMDLLNTVGWPNHNEAVWNKVRFTKCRHGYSMKCPRALTSRRWQEWHNLEQCYALLVQYGKVYVQMSKMKQESWLYNTSI